MTEMDALRLERYELRDVDAVPSPQLLFYPEGIAHNIAEMIRHAGPGGAAALWPHVKTYKSPYVTRMLLEQGITRFKCATIAEAEMVAELGPSDICLAYPLVGPNIARFLSLEGAYPDVRFWAIADDLSMLAALDAAAEAAGRRVRVLVDVDFGMQRTGVPLAQLRDFIAAARRFGQLEIRGLHCYDGDINDPELERRRARVAAHDAEIRRLLDTLEQEGQPLDTLILGGSPTFVPHTEHFERYFSPGTYILNDIGYYRKYRELDCPPAAALLVRVISHPGDGLFTLDLGYKAIAAESPLAERAYLVGYGSAVEPVLQNEEHLVYRLLDPQRERPAVGSALYIIPKHICPTTALYDEALAVVDGQVSAAWPISARTRRIRL